MLTFYCGSGGSSKYDSIAFEEGWSLGIRSCGKYKPGQLPIKFIDNNWKSYDHQGHLKLVRAIRPMLATARDIENKNDLKQILKEAEEIAAFCKLAVVLIPKVAFEVPHLDFNWIWGFSVPTRYGGCDLPLSFFSDRPVHLLGGSPQQQACYANLLNVQSLDCNSMINLARFGKSTWPSSRPGGEKVVSGCYSSFRISARKTKEFWRCYNESNREIFT